MDYDDELSLGTSVTIITYHYLIIFILRF